MSTYSYVPMHSFLIAGIIFLELHWFLTTKYWGTITTPTLLFYCYITVEKTYINVLRFVFAKSLLDLDLIISITSILININIIIVRKMNHQSNGLIHSLYLFSICAIILQLRCQPTNASLTSVPMRGNVLKYPTNKYIWYLIYKIYQLRCFRYLIVILLLLS